MLLYRASSRVLRVTTPLEEKQNPPDAFENKAAHACATHILPKPQIPHAQTIVHSLVNMVTSGTFAEILRASYSFRENLSAANVSYITQQREGHMWDTALHFRTRGKKLP